PANPLNVVDKPGLGDALNTTATLVGVALAVAIGYFLIRRWRAATPALRKTMWPVLLAVAGLLATIVVSGIASAVVSEDSATAISPVFLLFFAAIPIAFLFGILRTRLARSGATDVLLALERGSPLRDALAQVLGDPTIDIVYRRPGTTDWVD